jgi:hypothetical protein
MGTISSAYVRDLVEKTSPESEDCFVLGNETAGRINLSNLVKAIANVMLPVGHILMTTRNVNPGTYLGGTWVAWGSGRVPTGVSADDADYNESGKTGGAKTLNLAHSHTVNSHSHTVNSHQHIAPFGYDDNVYYAGRIYGSTVVPASGIDGYNFKAASSGMASPLRLNYTSAESPGTSNSAPGTNSQLGSRDIRQPYITCYMWKRTA